MELPDLGWISTVPIAHRGFHGNQIPENSLPAFMAAADAGYGIELDVHCASDDRLVVTHDNDMLRMTGHDVRVADLTSEELSSLQLSGSIYTVPLLDDVLHKIAGRVPVLVEVKTGSSMVRMGPALQRSLADYRGPVAVQSFDPRVLIWMKRNVPDTLRGQLSGSFSKENLSLGRRWLLRTMALNVMTRPQFIAYDIEAMPNPFVSFWRTILRVPLLLWTVQSSDGIAKASKYRANIIFENVTPG